MLDLKLIAALRRSQKRKRAARRMPSDNAVMDEKEEGAECRNRLSGIGIHQSGVSRCERHFFRETDGHTWEGLLKMFAA